MTQPKWLPISEWRSGLHGDAIWGLNEAWNPCIPQLLEYWIHSSGKSGWKRPDRGGFMKPQPTLFVPIPIYPGGRKIDDILFPSITIRIGGRLVRTGRSSSALTP